MSAYREIYYVFDKPVPYKSLLIYPVKVQDYYELATYISCLMIEKNSIRDPILAMKAISMSYLRYMYENSNSENQYIQLFNALLRLVLQLEEGEEIKYGYKENEEPYFRIKNIEYYSGDFDEIRKIISEQNMIDLPNEKIQKDVREALEKAKRFKERLNKNKTASFEEQMIALSIYSGLSTETIYGMTYRKFTMAIRRANQIIMSGLYLNAHLTGFSTFKDKSILKSWIADLNEDDKYSDVKIDSEDLRGKVSGNK